MHRSCFIIGVALILTLAGPPRARAQVPYNYVPIATTGGTSPYAQLFAPSLNASDTVSFGAILTNQLQRISTSNGTTTTIVAENGAATVSPYFRFNAPNLPIFTTIQPSVPAANQVAFFTGFNDGRVGIVRSNGASTVTIASSGVGSTFIDFTVGPNINAGGVVSFVGVLGVNNQRVLTGSGGTPTQIATTGTNVIAFNAFTGINNTGLVSFTAGGPGGEALFAGNGTSTAPIAATGTVIASFVGPSAINDAGQVAFVANRVGGGQSVFIGTGSALTDIANTGPSYTRFGDYVDITSGGAVVFAAELVGGGQGIFTGPNPVANRIIRSGDALDGSTVSSVVLFPSSVNDLGRVAFLANGRQGIYIAVPVPEPAGVLAVAAGAAGLVAAARRRRRAAECTAG